MMQESSSNESSQVANLSIEFAKKYITDQSFCDLLQHQEKIAQDDPVEASEIQSRMNSLLYRFLKEKQLSHTLSGKMKVAFSLMRQNMIGKIENIDSPEARAFINTQLANYPHFYGTS